VVDSVHTFGKSLVGDFFLSFLVVATLLSIALVIWRWTALKPERPLDGFFTREAAVLAANCLLVGMMLITLIGTMYPAISRNLFGRPQTVQANFYNTLVLPLGLMLVVLMGVGPLLGYGRAAAGRVGRLLAAPAAVALLTVVTLFVFDIRSIWALASGAAAAVVIAAVAADFARALKARADNLKESYTTAIVRIVVANHRRYAAQVVHAGLAMMVVGIAGSSLYTHKQDLQLTPGRSAMVGGHTLTLVGLEERRAANFTALEAEVTLQDAAGRRQTLRPQHRDYNKHEQDNTEVALRSNWRQDVYVTLAGWDLRDGRRLATLQVLISPLVWWIWAGGVVLTAGALLCLIPRAGARRAAAELSSANPAPVHHRRKRPRATRRKRQQRLSAAVS
jgi:cytochrome c-type biogenesis protein CcmF